MGAREKWCVEVLADEAVVLVKNQRGGVWCSLQSQLKEFGLRSGGAIASLICLGYETECLVICA